ncbi:putative tricarboxylic transport membrane protein [Bradyrhizobium sp. i1.3.1]
MMDTFAALAHGMAVAVQPMNLLYALIGVFLGTAVGVLPGIGPALTVALLLPVTYKLDPGGSLIMFAGIYYGGMYGGSTTAILINTPGESASMATALEGNKMAKAGRGGPALATSAIGSFVAGTIATIGLAFLAPWLVDFAVRFGPEDYFALMCVAFVTVSATFGDSPIRGLTSLFIGLTLGLVGIDKLTGQARLAFGVPELLDGVEVTTLAVGLFAVGEALYVASRRHHTEEKLEPVRGSLWMTKEDWRRSWKPWLRGTMFGFPIGALPAGGAEIPTFLSYSTEKRLTKHPEEFGKGAIEGVAGPEAANNASAAGTLVPLLTLGLPTSATAAMMLAGFQQYGLNPGPLLFAERPDLVWGLIASLFIANCMLLVLNLPLVGLWVRLLAIPQPWLYAGILVFATMGTIAAKPSVVELSMLAGFGVLGFLMRRFDFPIAPVVVGLILGPIAESQLRRALAISLGDPMTLLQSPISATLLGIALVALLAPVRAEGDGALQGERGLAVPARASSNAASSSLRKRHAVGTSLAPSRRPDRCRQRLCEDRGWAVRGDCQDRRGQRPPHLWRLLQCTVQGLGRHSVEARHHPAAAIRLYDGKECLRHNPGDRRHGPASQRPVRRLLPGLLRQRLYPSGRPHP